MVVDASEFPEAMEINEIEFFFAPGAAEDMVQFDEFYLHLGYCASDELSNNYQNNYVNGWKYKVYERTTPVVFHSSDPVITFDTPFFYDPSQGNLLFEIAWPNGRKEFYVYDGPSTGNSLLYGSYFSDTGDLYGLIPHLMFNGTLALEQTTFAGIKASFQ